ncbi:MFS family permease [Klebsiella sp. SORGH_AS 1025]|uniref:MFS transporter n=1 Tax=Klebsiella variicola TaxID=244366 RepID=UPI0028626D66|nr:MULTISPECIES: MFS transporter [Klebsiella]MDR6257742.1 MFS family permease [Klebsiella sp. SORGH_AS_0826]MDR6246906.1 MFS family permease [Klebsiella variicola]MDR6252442.1 MFS family permease [Klebsiella variicola]MDR6271551.1 MFS family permease [Klebsiella variicola]MDR6278872.1 MFS family permease [Klebsiella variicola]
MGRLQDTGTKPVSMIAVLAVSLSTVIAMLDSTIANVALPLIAKDFSVSESASILIINAYQFAVIATLLPFSALGRTLGNPRIFMAGVVLFALSSLGCSLSTSLNMLTLFRIIQGLGAAAILSVNAALIKAIYPPRLLGRGLASTSWSSRFRPPRDRLWPPASCRWLTGTGSLRSISRWPVFHSFYVAAR